MLHAARCAAAATCPVLSNAPGNEPNACTGRLNQVRQSVVGPVENPIAGLRVPRAISPACSSPAGLTEAGRRRTLPIREQPARAFPVWRARSDRDVTPHPLVPRRRVPDGVGTRAWAILVDGWFAVPQFKGRRLALPKATDVHGRYFEFSRLRVRTRCRALALCAIVMGDGGARLGQELFACQLSGEPPLRYAPRVMPRQVRAQGS